MSYNVLLTGASGYLGGDVLARLSHHQPNYRKLFALVRNDEHAQAVQKYGAKPLRFDVKDATRVREAILENSINVVFFLIDAGASEAQVNFINALGDLKTETGKEVHFLHTSGAKLCSSLTGAPSDEPILDTQPDLYEIQAKQKASLPYLEKGVRTNQKVIDLSESKGVKSYIFFPCIVYGKSKGFGNPISIQTRAIVQAAREAGAVFDPNEGQQQLTWPVCHVGDNSKLYIRILEGILNKEAIGYGKNGYYLASPGNVAWSDLYAAMAKALVARGIIKDANVVKAKDEDLQKMATGIGCPKELVLFSVGGSCTLTAVHGREIGWKAEYSPAHILETAAEEVEGILQHLKL